MWYIPKKLISALQPGAEDLILDSSSRARALAASLTWNERHFVSRTWSLRWKREHWMRHLSGTMYQPSTERSFITRYAESLADIHVNRSPLPATCLGTRTRVTFGLTSSELSTTPDLPGFGSKMSHTICGLDLSESGMTFSDWVTKLRRQWSGLRKTVARRTRESGCLSWRTPSSSETDGNPIVLRKGVKPRELKQYRLRDQIYNWQTPTKRDPEKKMYTLDRGDKNKKRPTLTKQAKNWDTPKASHADKAGPNMRDKAGRPQLSNQACNWNTPSTRDHAAVGPKERKRGEAGNAKTTDQRLRGDLPSGPQAPASSKNGGKSSSDTRRLNPQQQMRRLNPKFVEWLLGWPIGFTAFECSATEWYRYKRLWRSVLCWILLGEKAV